MTERMRLADVEEITLFIKRLMRRALEAAANARAMTMSAWIREAIQEKLEREKEKAG